MKECRSHFSTCHEPPGGWDGNAPQGCIIPPDFSAPSILDPPEDCSTLPKARCAVINQGRCAIERIKLQRSQAELCIVSIHSSLCFHLLHL